MKKFKLFWLGGQEEIVEGNDIADAFRHAGYGGGAIRALDYYKEMIEEKPYSPFDDPPEYHESIAGK